MSAEPQCTCPVAGRAAAGSCPVHGFQALRPDVVKKVRAEIAERWPPNKIPEGWPPFDLEMSDGCTGVREIAQECCALHDAEYWYGRTWRDKLLADWRLATCVWKASRNPPQPWAALPAWWLLGLGRGLGVALFGWWSFNKDHKR